MFEDGGSSDTATETEWTFIASGHNVLNSEHVI